MSTPTHQIRARFDQDTITVYQAFRREIAEAAVAHNKFVPPFSLGRMTWIKPSFLWMMERSGWGEKAGQEHILAVTITRVGWEEALGQAVLTHAEKGVYKDGADWEQQAESALVRVQWDAERDLRGYMLNYRSIQVGLSHHIVPRYVEEWTKKIEDITMLVRHIHSLREEEKFTKAARLLPLETPYFVPPAIARNIGLNG